MKIQLYKCLFCLFPWFLHTTRPAAFAGFGVISGRRSSAIWILGLHALRDGETICADVCDYGRRKTWSSGHT